MSDVVVMGGGPIGLATAMLLAADGREVIVLEKDDSPAPASASEAWERWERKGVAQFRQSHYMQAKFRHLLEDELPLVRDELQALGAQRHSLIGMFASTIHDRSPRPADERFETLTARRPIIEAAFARVADDTPGVEVRRGVIVDAPIAEGIGVPRVIGVRTRDGEQIRADLVVDALGRKSSVVENVTGLGGRAPYEEASDAGFAYYARHFRGVVPEARGPFFTAMSTIAVLTLPADVDTWAVLIICSAGDAPMKVLRQREKWERVIRSVPHLEHWIDGEPLQDPTPMAGVMDRYRRFVVDGEPVVTGMVAVGDAWACTNPQAGRGVSVGLLQAIVLRDVLRKLEDPHDIAMEFDRGTEEQCTPWYQMQVERDRARHSAVQNAIDGREAAPIADPLSVAAAYDPDVARAQLEMLACLSSPTEVMTRPGLRDKITAASAGRELPPVPGPTRAELLALVA